MSPIRNTLVLTKKGCTRLSQQDRQCKCIKIEYESTYSDSTGHVKFDLYPSFKVTAAIGKLKWAVEDLSEQYKAIHMHYLSFQI